MKTNKQMKRQTKETFVQYAHKERHYLAKSTVLLLLKIVLQRDFI